MHGRTQTHTHPSLPRFQPCNGSSYPDAASPTLSQSVDSVSPVPRVTSPHLPSDHYYNSLRKYQLDTLPVGAGSTEGVGGGGGGGGGRVVEVQVHSQTLNEQKQIDSGHYSRPTHHPSLPPSTHLTSHPPPFQPPPTLPSSSSSSSHQHPSYTLPTSHPLYSTPRKGNTAHRPQVHSSLIHHHSCLYTVHRVICVYTPVSFSCHSAQCRPWRIMLETLPIILFFYSPIIHLFFFFIILFFSIMPVLILQILILRCDTQSHTDNTQTNNNDTNYITVYFL